MSSPQPISVSCLITVSSLLQTQTYLIQDKDSFNEYDDSRPLDNYSPSRDLSNTPVGVDSLETPGVRAMHFNQSSDNSYFCMNDLHPDSTTAVQFPVPTFSCSHMYAGPDAYSAENEATSPSTPSAMPPDLHPNPLPSGQYSQPTSHLISAHCDSSQSLQPERQETSSLEQDRMEQPKRKRKRKTKKKQAADGDGPGGPGGGTACPRGGTANVAAARDAAAQVEADAVAWDQEVDELVKRQRKRGAREAARWLEAEFEDEPDVAAEGEGPSKLPVGAWVKQPTRNKQTLRPTGATIMNGLTTINVEELASYMEKFLSGDTWKEAIELFFVNTLVAIAD